MSICLSTAVNLRCLNFEERTYIGLAVPTFIEFFWTSYLAYRRPKESARDWLLVLEGWTYLVLTITDLISRTHPTVRQDLSYFKIFDILVGVGSCLPLVILSVYIFLVFKAVVSKSFPQPFRSWCSHILASFIPILFVMDLLGSFVGVSYIQGADSLGNAIIGVGFLDERTRNMWNFFSYLAIGSFGAFQILAVFIFLYHLIYSFHLVARSDEKKTTQGLRGSAWMAAGFTLGATETFLAFIPSQLARSLVRRLLRMASRICLIMGAIYGTTTPLDEVSIYRELIDTSQKRGASRLSRLLFGNPATRSSSRRQPVLDGRVTVHFDRQKLPVLSMRLSQTDLPDPTLLMDRVKGKQHSRNPSSSSDSHQSHKTYPSMIGSRTTLSHLVNRENTDTPPPNGKRSSPFAFLKFKPRTAPTRPAIAVVRESRTSISVTTRRNSLLGPKDIGQSFPNTPSTIRPFASIYASRPTTMIPEIPDAPRKDSTVSVESELSRQSSTKRKPVPKDIYIPRPNTIFNNLDEEWYKDKRRSGGSGESAAMAGYAVAPSTTSSNSNVIIGVAIESARELLLRSAGASSENRGAPSNRSSQATITPRPITSDSQVIRFTASPEQMSGEGKTPSPASPEIASPQSAYTEFSQADRTSRIRSRRTMSVLQQQNLAMAQQQQLRQMQQQEPRRGPPARPPPARPTLPRVRNTVRMSEVSVDERIDIAWSPDPEEGDDPRMRGIGLGRLRTINEVTVRTTPPAQATPTKRTSFMVTPTQTAPNWKQSFPVSVRGLEPGNGTPRNSMINTQQ